MRRPTLTEYPPVIFAIDPGINGAWAAVAIDGVFMSAGEIPRFEKLVNGIEFASILGSFDVHQVVIERVHAMPKQGVSSVFTFGAAYGVCIGVACGAGKPITYVTPQSWKGHFRLGKSKDSSREKAIRLFPESMAWLKLKKHHGRAEAILLARYFLDGVAKGDFV